MTEKLVAVRLKAITDEYKREMSEAANVSKRWGDDFTATADRVGKKMQTVGAGLTAGITVPLLAIGKQAVNAASDLQEAENVAGLVFGDMRDQIDAAADSSVELAGLSKRAYFEAASGVGGLLDNLGFAREETVQWSQDLVTLAADMGSAFNTSTEDAIQAIGAGLRGESEPLKRFNVFLSETELKTRAVEMGLADTTSEVDRNAKAQAALNAIMEQTSSVQGDWANTQDETAGSLKKARAEWENATAALGESLLPVVADAAGFIAELLQRFQELPPAVQDNIVKFGGLAAAAGPLMVVAGTLLRNFQQIKGVLGARTTGMAGAFFVSAAGVSAMANAMSDLVGGTRDLSNLNREIDHLLATGNTEGALDSVFGMEGITRALDYIADPSLGQNAFAGLSRAVDTAGQVVTLGMLDIRGSIHEGEESLKALDQALADLVSSGNGDQASELMEMITNAAEEQGVNLNTLLNVFPEYAREVEIAGAAHQDAAEATGEHADEQAELDTATRRTTEALKGQYEELRRQADPLLGLQGAVENLKESQTAYNEAVDEFGPNSDEARRAAGEMGTAFLDARGAAMLAQEEIGPGLVTELQKTARQMGLNEDQVDGLTALVVELAGTADEYAGDYRATFAADTAEAQARLEALIGTVDRLNRSGVTHVAVPGTTHGGRTFHSGGRVGPGDLLRGPGDAPDEGWAKLQYGEVVTPRSADTQSSTSIGSQMTVAEGAIQIVTADAAGTAREQSWALRKLAYR